ncbi:MAG: hypothetical protein P8M22_06340 [Phycisphaerales bacterium]|nr:hypothetical protein [Phycisphaerales bacterium]
MSLIKNTLIAATAGLIAATSSAMATTEMTYNPYYGYDAYGYSGYGYESASMWADYYRNITGAYFGYNDPTLYGASYYNDAYAGYGYMTQFYYNPYAAYAYNPYYYFIQ